MMSNFGSSWWVVPMVAGMVLFWGLVAWAVLLLIGSRTPHREEVDHGDSPRQILDQRLARAEIESDEYAHLRLLLGDKRSPVSSGGG